MTVQKTDVKNIQTDFSFKLVNQKMTLSDSASTSSEYSKSKHFGLIETNGLRDMGKKLYYGFEAYFYEFDAPESYLFLVAIIRMLLIITPSLDYRNSTIWNGDGDILRRIIANFYLLNSYSDESDVKMKSIGLSIITIGFYGIFMIISNLYWKDQKIRWKTPLIIYYSFLNHVIPSILSHYLAIILNSCFQSRNWDMNSILCSVLITISLLITIVFYIFVNSMMIAMQTDSLVVINPFIQIWSFVLQIICPLIIGLTCSCDQNLKTISNCILICILIMSVLSLINDAGIVNPLLDEYYLATQMSSAIIVSFNTLAAKLSVNYPSLILPSLIVSFIVSNIIIHYTKKSKLTKSLYILDSLEENKANLDNINSSKHFRKLLFDGFSFSHPICFNQSIFINSMNKWKDSFSTWLCLTKFSAIYPENSKLLALIPIQMKSNGYKGEIYRFIKIQIRTILRQREINLVPELRASLEKLNKERSTIRNRIRHIWELIIQGNSLEIEGALHLTFLLIEKTSANFLQILKKYPNNKYASRTYAKFLGEIQTDTSLYNIWVLKSRAQSLGSGIPNDVVKSFAIKQFPLLPFSLLNEPSEIGSGAIFDDSIGKDLELDEETTCTEKDQKISFQDSIDKLNIPSYKKLRTIRWTNSALNYLPILILMIYISLRIELLTNHMYSMYHLSNLRTQLFHVVGVSQHYILEKMADCVPYMAYDEPPPVSLGNSSDSVVQLEFLIDELSKTLYQTVKNLQANANDKNTIKIREVMFDEYINFSKFSDDSDSLNYEMMSCQEAIMEYLVISQDILEKNISLDILNDTDFLSMFQNLKTISVSISDAIKFTRESIHKDIAYITEILIKILILLVSITVFINVILTLFVNKMVTKEKQIIQRCSSSIPKIVLSKIVDEFKNVKNDENKKSTSHSDSDMSKQEDSLLKTLQNSETSINSFRDITSQSIFMITIVIIQILTIFIAVMYINRTSVKFEMVAPHLDYILGSYTYDFASIVYLHFFGVLEGGFIFKGIPRNDIVSNISYWSELGRKNYFATRFGEPELNALPFEGITRVLSENNRKGECEIIENSEVYSIHDTYKCWDPDILYSFVVLDSYGVVEKYTNSEFNVANDEYIMTLHWHIMLYHMYDQYILPISEKIIPAIMIMTKGYQSFAEISILSLVCVCVILEFVLYSHINRSEKIQKFMLKLLLQAPSNMLLSNSTFVNILSGNFIDKVYENSINTVKVYQSLVQHSPESIIITDKKGIISFANNATNRILSLNPDNLINKNIVEVGTGFSDSNPFHDIEVKTQKLDNEKELHLKYHNEQNSISYIEVKIDHLNENIVVTMKDETQSIVYNKLITDERLKIDKLLASILPQKLVTRVRNGEKNISFSVQCCSIVFIDIVEFTPWCGSNPVKDVVSTLNRIFKEFDSLISQYSTMTKIKCIGDCYMAASGLFDEINQPALFAKEAVDFGIQAIDAIKMINTELNQNLRIRIGIHSGGPIVAGVFGIDKPTFEILGPAIPMAQQMEHHAPPMITHISRSVYELVYGSSYMIKERGEIEIKTGKTLTYLVEKQK